jgi:hypothetical protein
LAEAGFHKISGRDSSETHPIALAHALP